MSEHIIRVTKRLKHLLVFFCHLSFYYFIPSSPMLNNKYVKLFLTLRDDNSHWFYFLFVVLMLYWSPEGKTTAKLKYIILHEFIIINQFLNLVLIHQGMSTCLSVTYCRIKIWTTLGWYFLERTAVVEAGKGKWKTVWSSLGQLFDCQERMMEGQKKADKLFTTERARHKQTHRQFIHVQNTPGASCGRADLTCGLIWKKNHKDISVVSSRQQQR